MNTLARKHPNTKHVQVGRGGKRGKTSGRGTKGQNARSGHRKRPELRDIIKKLPKKRGYGKNRAKSSFVKPQAAVVNLSVLEKVFAAGSTISPVSLLEKGILKSTRLPKAGVKILGTGEVTKVLHISACEVSASAKTKIEAAGGSVA
jgi:large subunit ribosomal protein L15